MPEQDTTDAYRISTAEALKHFGSQDKGLSAQEAAERLISYGRNELKRVKKGSILTTLARQLNDFMIMLLIASIFISWLIGDHRTSIILIFVVLINTMIGFTQEYNAEQTMASLEKLVVPLAKVKRDGSVIEIPSAELVPGDIIYVEEGDSVPADARIIDEISLASNDFALTGESNPSRKFTHPISAPVELANRHNLMFMGTTVATGHGFCLVIGTGMRTELGRIAHLSLGAKSGPSPLQREMRSLATTITKAVILIAIVIAPVAWYAGDGGFKSIFIFVIGVASALIPQGLPAEVNTALSSAAARLARSKALVKKLSAVETLGATSVICTDKTGTLTKNEMTVEQLLIGGQKYLVSGTGYEANGAIEDNRRRPISADKLENLKHFFTIGTFASNASIHFPDNDHPNWYCVGDPTEGALITLSRKAGLDPDRLIETHPELLEFPFDSARKRMSSVREYEGHVVAFAKGAPESILEICSQIWDGKRIRVMTATDRQAIQNQADNWARHAMRNLAFASKTLKPGAPLRHTTMNDIESGLVFYGLVSMIDPPRDEVPAAMAAARAAHIPVSIITGDNALTAKAIAIKVGLASHADDLVLVAGQDLQTMSDHDIAHLVSRGQVIFSRVAPDDKLRIVEIAKQIHHVVAVTGDGINDAPALKLADIGVAMGRTGTDVAKQSAEIVLLDDSFKTLIDAVETGRTIFQNIKKAALSCLTTNSAELVVVIIGLTANILLNIPFAITAVLILGIDLVAELFPIAALGWDPPQGNIMTDKPRNLNEHILNRSSITDLLGAGVLIGVIAYTNFLVYFWRHGMGVRFADTSLRSYAIAISLTYLTICLCQFGNILLRRLRPGSKFFTAYLWSNPRLLFAYLASLSCMLAIIYVPVMQRYLGTGSLAITDWIFALGGAAIFMIIRHGIALRK